MKRIRHTGLAVCALHRMLDPVAFFGLFCVVEPAYVPNKIPCDTAQTFKVDRAEPEPFCAVSIAVVPKLTLHDFSALLFFNLGYLVKEKLGGKVVGVMDLDAIIHQTVHW